MVSYPQKVDALTRILEVENFEGMIVFVRTKNETETLAEKLRARGFSAMAINGDVAQAQRERTVNQLKSGKLDILVATDVAARGLDVERISHVVNYDIPTDTESYVHRIGRTGRAGRSGDAISFVTPRERYLLKRDREGHPPAADADAAADRRGRQRHPAGPLRRRDHRGARPRTRSSFFRDVVAHYVREHDVPEVDVAAALAVVLQGDDPAAARARAERPARRAASDRTAATGPSAARDRRRRAPARGGRTDGPMATYRIAVGKRHKVEPRQIVGALANEGGLSRSDFGAHQTSGPTTRSSSCPPSCRPAPGRRSRSTRISGKLIDLRATRAARRTAATVRRSRRSRATSSAREGGGSPFRSGSSAVSTVLSWGEFVGDIRAISETPDSGLTRSCAGPSGRGISPMNRRSYS